MLALGLMGLALATWLLMAGGSQPKPIYTLIILVLFCTGAVLGYSARKGR